MACVLPLRGNPDFALKAVEYLARQGGVGVELLVLADPIRGDLATDLAAFAEERGVQARVAIGSCPALDDMTIARLAEQTQDISSDYLAWWHPCDWSAPWRLADQVRLMLETDSEAVVGRGCVKYLVRFGAALETSGLRESSAVVRRAATADGRATRVPGVAEIIKVDRPDWYVVVDTGRRSDGAASPLPFGEVADRLGPDIDAFGSWRAGRRLTSPTRRSGRRPLNVATPLMVADGFGSMGEYLVRSISRTGTAVNVTPLSLHRGGLSRECLQIVESSDPHPDDPTLCWAWVGVPLQRFRHSRPLVVYTAWESTQLPDGFADGLNLARAVVVPSTWVREVLLASGVTAPVEVVPHGADPQRYRPRPDRPPRRGLTTLIVASMSPRKNIPQAVAAWRRAFDGDPHARLVIKSRFGWQAYVPEDPRILFVDEVEATPGIAHWYARADILLALGAEGFGLPMVEAMACGLPVVALDAQGQQDIVRDAPGLVLPVGVADWVPYDDGNYRTGLRAVADVEEAATALAWVASHPVEAAQLGRDAAAWAHQHRDVWQMGPAVLDVVRRHLDGQQLAHTHPRRLDVRQPVEAMTTR